MSRGGQSPSWLRIIDLGSVDKCVMVCMSVSLFILVCGGAKSWPLLSHFVSFSLPGIKESFILKSYFFG